MSKPGSNRHTVSGTRSNCLARRPRCVFRAAGSCRSVVTVTVTAAPQDVQRLSSEPLWRAIAVFRFASLGYAGLRLSTAVLQYQSGPRHGVTPVTATWLAGPILAWAVRYGRRGGTIAALVMSGCDLALLRGAAFSVVVNGVVLLLLLGVIVGHLARLAAEVEAERQHAIEVEAASRERERLARDIHDSVLQVLALVQRRGAEAGGAAAELGQLAGQQEAALRALVGDGMVAGAAGGPVPDASGAVDLRAVIRSAQTDRVTVSAPAQAVLLDSAAADELASAMRAALDNVRRHCGERTRAWVLIEDEPGLVTVTIRDDGPGIPAGRLAEAAATGPVSY